MEPFSLVIERREAAGKGPAQRVRRGGNIPAIVYHRGEASIPSVVSKNDFQNLAGMASHTQIFQFKSKDKGLDGKSALVKEIQRDHIKGSVLHVDFQALRDDEEIRIEVTLKIVGDPYGVKNEGGILTVQTHEIEISCLPKDIPLYIPVDVSELKLGDSLHVRDLTIPSGVRLETDGEEPVASVTAPQAVVEPQAAAPAEGEAAEGAAAEGGEAAAAAGSEKKEKE